MRDERAFRDRADDSFLSLVGDLPGLIRDLVVAEINAAKVWVARAGKHVGLGGAWFAVALFFLFWAIPVLLTVFIAVLAIWLPVWASALIVFGIGLILAAICGFMGLSRFKKLVREENPAQAVAKDARLMRGEDDDWS